jgi:YfiH family protein
MFSAPWLFARNLDSAEISHGFGTRSAPPITVATARQIHSDRVLFAESNQGLGEGDAIITNVSGVGIAIKTADCYPILLADPRNKAVGAVHAGWRGTAAEIVKKTLVEMRARFGTEARDVRAAIGPGIGVCCYEVGDEVARQFKKRGRTHLDLAKENAEQLAKAGVLPENTQALGICTYCDAERFFSFRREKEHAGRMISFIRLR